mgnify:FL=1|tara:strand:+ start:4046 stop:4741 length:696 start_codon:yes stop_codon:yes gene_type:complete
MSIFRFKKFSIIQEKSAMKVGTDGVLLGCWVACQERKRVLDIGCGTGLITLMLAQRNLNSNITGIEIDKIACEEAKLNICNSDWDERISIKHTSLQDFKTESRYDLIVSNPPFFPQNKSRKSRDIARHTNSLSFQELLINSASLLTENGILSIIIPKNYEEYFCNIAISHKLYPKRFCYVRGNELSKVIRVMIEFSFIKSISLNEYLTIEKSRHLYTDKYIQLCKNFYFNM